MRPNLTLALLDSVILKAFLLKKRGNDCYKREQGLLRRVFLSNVTAVKTPCKGLGSASLSASEGHHLLTRPFENTFPSGQTCLGICQVLEAEGVSGFCLRAAETNETGSQEHSSNALIHSPYKYLSRAR